MSWAESVGDHSRSKWDRVGREGRKKVAADLVEDHQAAEAAEDAVVEEVPVEGAEQDLGHPDLDWPLCR